MTSIENHGHLSAALAADATPLPAPTFREAFCALTGTPLPQFETALFRRCLYFHARFVAPILLKINSAFFDEDFDAIREIESVKCPEVLTMEIARFHGRNKRDSNWLRRWFLIRISGKRLTRWKTRCFQQ